MQFFVVIAVRLGQKAKMISIAVLYSIFYFHTFNLSAVEVGILELPSSSTRLQLQQSLAAITRLPLLSQYIQLTWVSKRQTQQPASAQPPPNSAAPI